MTTEHDAAVAAAYDARAAEYVDLLGAVDQMDATDRALIERWGAETPGLLVDAGSGPGHWTALLHESGREVVGIELSAAFVASARRRFPDVRFETASFRDLPCDDASVGGILAWYSLIHTPPADVPVVLAEFARAVVQGGSILVGLFDGESGTPFEHAVTTAYFWSAESFTTLLADAGFEVVAAGRRPATAAHRAHLSLSARRV